MKWNLRMVAAERGIWQASELRRALSEAGLDISKGKMSKLWTHSPVSVRLVDLDVFCAVLDCEPSDLLLPAGLPEPVQQVATVAQSTIRPTRRGGRSLPPA